MKVIVSYNYMEYGNVVFEDDVGPEEAVDWAKNLIIEVGKALKPIRDRAYNKQNAPTKTGGSQTASKSASKAPQDGNVTFTGKLLYDPKVEFKDGEKGTYAKCNLVVKGNDGVTYSPSFIGEIAEKIGSGLNKGDEVKITGELKINKSGGKTYNNIWNAKLLEPNPDALGGPPADEPPPPDYGPEDDIPF